MTQLDFSIYTEGAGRAINGAQREVRRQGRRCVMPVDLLVGLLLDKEKSSAARRALSILGIEASAVCRTLDRIEAPAAGHTIGRHTVTAKPLPEGTEATFGSDSNRVFVRATELAEADGASFVGTEHLLLALYDDPIAPLVRVILQDFGVKDGGERKARDMLVEALEEATRSRSTSDTS